jgi:hypothetical protein
MVKYDSTNNTCFNSNLTENLMTAMVYILLDYQSGQYEVFYSSKENKVTLLLIFRANGNPGRKVTFSLFIPNVMKTRTMPPHESEYEMLTFLISYALIVTIVRRTRSSQSAYNGLRATARN